MAPAHRCVRRAQDFGLPSLLVLLSGEDFKLRDQAPLLLAPENLNLGRSVGIDSSLATLALLRCDTCRPATSVSEVWNKSLPQMSASTEYSSG